MIIINITAKCWYSANSSMTSVVKAIIQYPQLLKQKFLNKHLIKLSQDTVWRVRLLGENKILHPLILFS